MIFNRHTPAADLSPFIECFWMAESEDREPSIEKIIPDGFAEIIFHFGDPYRIKLNDNDEWSVQGDSLVAGQITRYFFLENTGRSSILGVKMKPAALASLFSLTMPALTNNVMDINFIAGAPFTSIGNAIRSVHDWNSRVQLLTDFFRGVIAQRPDATSPIDNVIAQVFELRGMVSMQRLQTFAGVGERQLENLFRQFVGLSPKRFSRIVRFNYIFELVRENKYSWSALAYEAAFYDQSHFIRNFRDFTGENPTDYSFDEKNMANFFLNKE